ncbi:MAG: type IV secretory system conjugative DNA transfer family protein [Clostridia bacterium]|nr:type IV secretory system conjugative DNA transfer family protein [Clostridia bacterium]
MYDVYKSCSICNKVKSTYNKKYFDDNKVISSAHFANERKIPAVRYYDLPQTEVCGYPLGNGRNEKGELIYYFQDIAHEMCAGTTRIGKTTGLLEPRLRAMVYKKEKPCMFISDPKGELFERNAKFMEKQGYKIYLLNFKDAVHSNSWNPLGEIYDEWIKLKELEDRIKHNNALLKLDEYVLEDKADAYNPAVGFWSIENRAYATISDARRALESEKAEIKTKTSGLINQLIQSIAGNRMEMSKDPIWEQGAQEILRGLIYLMLEDALDERSGFTKDNMSFMTIQEYYSVVRSSVLGDGNSMKPLNKTIKLMHKSYSDESMKHLRPFLENAPTTSRSYMGVFDNIMQEWFTPKMYTIATANDIDIENYAKQPFAIFLVTRDYEKSDFIIAGLFIDWVYQQMVRQADTNGGKLEREMFFMLDEFGNIPKINGFAGKISASLSRRIAFQMYVQSYAQIEAVYGANEAQIIRDNCNAQSFLGSQNYLTKSTFSKECGTRQIPTLASSLTPGVNQMQQTSVVSINDLENLKMGEMYLKKIGLPVIKTQFERAYMCEEFQVDNYTTPREMGFRSLPYNDEKFVYKYLHNDSSMWEKNDQDESIRVVTGLF